MSIRITTARGSSELDSFAPWDWILVGCVAATWGTSFFFTDLGLVNLPASVVAAARLIIGALTLAVFRQSRRPITGGDKSSIAVLGVVWTAVPAALITISIAAVDSAIAGMLNGMMPVFSVMIAAILLRQGPGMRIVLGITIGFAGVTVMATGGGDVTARSDIVAVVLLLLAFASAALGSNLAVPLQHRNGSLTITFRASVVGALLLVPWAISDLHRVDWIDPSTGLSWLAIIPLGALSSGVALVAFATLVGRNGGDRGVVPIYFVPVVATALGTVFGGEHIRQAQLLGAGLVTVAAVLVRKRRPRTP